MKYWVTSDTHMGHAKMLEYRPQDYEEKILRGVKNLSEKDVLIHLGDVCIGNDEENHKKYLEHIKCKKILVRGNHDKKSYSWYMNHGWDFVCEQFTLVYGGKLILFSHIPLCPSDDVINVHGHLHNIEHREYPEWYSKNHKLLSLEKHGYEPINLLKFIQ